MDVITFAMKNLKSTNETQTIKHLYINNKTGASKVSAISKAQKA